MAILNKDKITVIKSFAPVNPLPLDAREIHDSLDAAKSYAATSAVAYAGQTIKVVENNTVTVYSLVPSSVEGENFTLKFVGGGAGAVQAVTTSPTEGNVTVVTVDGETTTHQDVPVIGALINPVVDEDAHTLTLTKVGKTLEENTEVVIPLGGASPDTIISAVEAGTEGLTVKVTKFDVAAETETTETIKIFGAVTGINSSTAGVLGVSVPNAAGEAVVTKQALVGSVINASYNAETKTLTLPVVTGVENDVATTEDVVVNMNAVVAGMFVDVTAVADTDTESAKYQFTYKDADGADQTKTVYLSGVRKVEAGSTANKLKVTTANTSGTLTSTEILIGAGSVQNPEYDAETRKITLPVLQADGTTQNLEINLGKDMVVTSGVYNTETREIELTLTDGSVIKVPASALVDIYTGRATATISVSVSDTNEITATLKISTVEGNLLKTDENGVYVVEADFVATKQLIVDAQAAAEKHADDAVATEATARGTAVTNAITECKKYTDDKLAESATKWVDFGA